MNKILVILIAICVSFSQREITIYTVKDKTPAYDLEVNLVKNLFNLHNVSASEKLSFEIIHLSKFSDLFDAVKNAKDKNNVAAIHQITITTEREKSYSFSQSYLPIKESMFTKKSNVNDNYKRKGARIAFQGGSTQESQMKKYKKFGINPISCSSVGEKLKLLVDGKVDFVIGDNIEIWGRDEFKLIEDMPDQPGNGFGLMYPLNSNLKALLDKDLARYVKLKSYYQLLYKLYGSDVAKYYKKNMK